MIFGVLEDALVVSASFHMKDRVLSVTLLWVENASMETNVSILMIQTISQSRSQNLYRRRRKEVGGVVESRRR